MWVRRGLGGVWEGGVELDETGDVSRVAYSRAKLAESNVKLLCIIQNGTKKGVPSTGITHSHRNHTKVSYQSTTVLKQFYLFSVYRKSCDDGNF